MGRDAHQHFRMAAKPMMMDMTQSGNFPKDEFEFMGVKFKVDPDAEPDTITICLGGAPVRRIKLSADDAHDATPIVDHPTALAFEVACLRSFSGNGSVRFFHKAADQARVVAQPLPLSLRADTQPTEMPRLRTVGLNRLVELGLLYKAELPSGWEFGITLMGQSALRQFEAFGDG